MTSILCLSCGNVSDKEFSNSPALTRMKDWQDKMALFWGSYPYFFYILRTGLLWFALAVMAAYYEETREYTCVFVLMTLLTFIGKEFVPLAPIPFNVYNVVTSRCDEYTTAVKMSILVLFGLSFIGVFVVAAEQAGNVSIHARTTFTKSAISYWSIEPLPWLTILIIAIPLMYFTSLVVSTTFVSPYLNRY